MILKLAALTLLTITTLRFAIIATWTSSNKATDRFVLSLLPTVSMWLVVMEVI